MTWVAWRVQRLQFLAAAGAVLAFALWLLATGSHEHAAFTLFNHGCSGSTSPVCTVLANRWVQSQRFDYLNRLVLYAIPGVLGVVLGAPLVAREIEHGTNRVAWTQSRTRTYWLAAKLLVAGLFTAVVVGALMPLEQWWTGAAQLGAHVGPRVFDTTGIVSLGYALFAFMLGAALGAIIRRTGWAIAAGLPLFVAFRALVQFTLRPLLLSPLTAAGPPNPFTPFPPRLVNTWMLDTGYVPVGRNTPAAGQTWATGWDAFNRCFDAGVARFKGNYEATAAHCVTVMKLHYVIRYQPESHYWALQAWETAIFAAAALVLLGITVLAVRRWRT
jgi:hypothetical protein